MYLALGFFFVAVAALGVFLPLLPTTPFVLLAAAFFARSSSKWHAWLLANSIFGPMIRDWETNRCITFRVKVVAILSMLLVGGCSIYFAIDNPRLKIAGAALMAVGLFTITRIKTCRLNTGINQPTSPNDSG